VKEEYVRMYVQYPPYSELLFRIEVLGGIEVIKLQRVTKRLESFNSFVNMSAMLIFPSMCKIVTTLLATDSRIAFSRMVI